MNSKYKKKKPTKKTVKKTVKPKYKGVKYIAKELQKYFKKRYPNYTSALPRARQILDSIISSGGRVGVKAIFELERRKQKNPASKKVTVPVVPIAPELDEGLATPTNYFLLNEYSNYMERGSTEIWYRSTISPLGLMDIQGGETGLGEETYEIYFSDYVNYINSLVRLTEDEEDKDYTQNWQVVCTQPELDEETGRWISTIVSGNLVDNVFIIDELNFGFDNSNPDLLPDETTSLVKQSKSTPQPQKEPTTAKKKRNKRN
jgi:hypothetical protein